MLSLHCNYCIVLLPHAPYIYIMVWVKQRIILNWNWISWQWRNLFFFRGGGKKTASQWMVHNQMSNGGGATEGGSWWECGDHVSPPQAPNSYATVSWGRRVRNITKTLTMFMTLNLPFYMSGTTSRYRRWTNLAAVCGDAVPPLVVRMDVILDMERKGNVLFNDALNTFYLRLYGVRHMVKDHSDSEKGNPLPPHRLLFPINSKGSFICTIPQTG